MRRKKLLRQVAAAAVALSMAVSLSAPAFAATFDLSNGGLVITADGSGITVKQDNGTTSTYGADEEIEIKGTYSSANGAMQTAEENQQDENQPVTPAKAPAKEETSKETPEAEDAPAAEKKQEQKDAEAPADPEQKTETENKDKNNDPDNEEKKEQNASAEGEEQPKPKAKDEGQPKPEANASAEATASASDNASNGPRKAPAYEDRMSSWEEEQKKEEDSYKPGARTGIVQIINNTVNKIKVSLSGAHIDLPSVADTTARGMAAIDVQGSGEVELKFSGDNTLTGSGRSAGIQKNDKTQDGKENTGKLTITADNKSDTLDVKVDEYALGQDYQSAAIGGRGKKTYEEYIGYGTKNIVIEGNGTVNTNAQIGSGYRGGAATGIVIRGNAVVNVEKYGIGGYGLPSWTTEKPGGETDVTITGNANVTVKNGTIGSGVRTGEVCGDAKINISGNAVVNVEGGDNAAAIGSGAGGNADVTITDNAKVTAVQKSEWYGGGAGIGGGANGKGHVTIGGKAQVKATGSAEKHGGSGAYGAGAAIGDGGTTGKKGTDTVQNGKNEFSTDKGIQDGAEVKMTNIGHNGPNTVTQTRQNGQWVTDGKTEQPTEKCKHLNGEYAAEKVYPNCTETGSQTYRCSSCGEVTKVETLDVNPNRHSYGEVKFPATCTEDGYSVYTCSRCGKPETGQHYNIVKAPGHQSVEITVAPTCTESGYTVQKCSVCHEETGERTNLVAPLGHEYKNGVCIRCGAPEPQENGSAAPNYTVTGAETYETSVVDGRYIIAVPSEDAALNAVLGDLRAIKAQGADVVVFRTRSRESSLVIDEMLAMGTDVTPFVLSHNGGEAQLTINGAAHNELIH